MNTDEANPGKCCICHGPLLDESGEAVEDYTKTWFSDGFREDPLDTFYIHCRCLDIMEATRAKQPRAA